MEDGWADAGGRAQAGGKEAARLIRLRSIAMESWGARSGGFGSYCFTVFCCLHIVARIATTALFLVAVTRFEFCDFQSCRAFVVAMRTTAAATDDDDDD